MGRKEIQLGLVALVTVAFAGETQLHREGAFWVEVEKGSEPVTAHGNIQVSTIGGVSIKGAPGNHLSYSVVKRVKAGNEAQPAPARRLQCSASRKGELTYLVVQGGSEMAELEVTAPQASSLVVVRRLAVPSML
jgi:hypothetical protein